MEFDYYGPGRPVTEGTKAIMKKMLAAIKKEPQIPSAKLALELELNSLRCSVIAKKLSDMGYIKIVKKDRTLFYSIKS